MKFYDNLKNLRKIKKISQEELAEKVGVSRQSVSKWECGEAYPSMDNILKLCEIFHCTITELIQENLLDIDSLGEEVRMNVVKFKQEEQKKMKGLSKAISIISKIGEIASVVGIVTIIITMITTIVIGSNIKLKDDNVIEIFKEEIKFERTENSILFELQNKTNEITHPNEVFITDNFLKALFEKPISHSIILIESAFTCLIITLVLFNRALNHLRKLFINISYEKTPFTITNIDHIKKMAFLMILIIVIPNGAGILVEKTLNTDLGIGLELFDFVEILFLYSMSLIFEYGYKIQLDSKGQMYD